MKSKLLTIARLLNIYLVAALTLVYSSCSETELVDSTGFILQYYGVTDIGPSMTYTLEAPTYKGSTPYDFTITGVTLNEEAFENADYFVIDAETGAIAIQNTESIPTGLYNISVGCYSNGKYYNFKDAVQVNMLLAVPDGVTVEPAEVLVNQDEEDWAEASAQVTTEQDKHVSITGYSIVQDESKPYLAYFNIDGKGKITINPETKDKLVAGESYVLSLKLTTGAGEHMYADAVTFKVVSKPRTLVYKKKQDIYEKEKAGKSGVPTYEGGKDGLVFTIKSVTPETTAFSIDAATGEISLPEGHTLAPSTTPYVFTITASNTYGSTDFEEAYAVTISEYVTPIEESSFHYAPITKLYQLGGSATQAKDDNFVGDAVVFTFAKDLNSEEINKAIDDDIIKLIDDGKGQESTVSIADTHTLTEGEHLIYIRATNMKNEDTGGVATALSVNVVKNPNDFTYVSWGTNIEDELKEGVMDYFPKKENKSEYRNQFRFINKNLGTSGNTVKSISVQKSDIISPTITYKLIKKYPETSFPQLNIGEELQQGVINISGKEVFATFTGTILLIEVEAKGIDNAPPVKRNIPVFFSTPQNQKHPFVDENNQNKGTDNEVLLFTPFVVKVNPRTGACSNTEYKLIQWKNHSLQKELTTPNMVVDYRASFTYYNFDDNATHGSGTLKENAESNLMLFQVWENCGVKGASGMGTRVPMCYYKTDKTDYPGAGDLNTKAGYIDATSKQIVVNPEKWKGADNLYPNGAVIGDIRFDYDGNANIIHNGIEVDKKNGEGKEKIQANSYFSLILWFDETYEGN